MKKVKNNSGVYDVWCGQGIEPDEYYEIQEMEAHRWDEDDKVAVDVAVGKLIINDGTSDLSVAQVIVSAKIEAAMVFGSGLIVSYGTKNVLAGKTVAQIRAVSVKLAEIQTLLLSGSLYCARQAILDMVPDENVTQEDKDEFLAKLNAYLGL